MSKYILPIIILTTLIVGSIKKVNCYKSFVGGAKKSFEIVLGIFPYIITIMIMVQLMRISGLALILGKAFSPIFNIFGIPSEVCELILLKPFTGSGILTLLNNIYSTYGVDSYISRCASVIISSTDTVFYISTLYFSQTKVKRLLYAIPVSLFACFVGAILSCLLCRIL